MKNSLQVILLMSLNALSSLFLYLKKSAQTHKLHIFHRKTFPAHEETKQPLSVESVLIFTGTFLASLIGKTAC